MGAIFILRCLLLQVQYFFEWKHFWINQSQVSFIKKLKTIKRELKRLLKFFYILFLKKNRMNCYEFS